jgi:hypothetical protein
MTYGPQYPPFGYPPYAGPYPIYPPPMPIMTPSKMGKSSRREKKRRLKEWLEAVQEDIHALDDYQRKNKKEESKKSKFSTGDWFMILCVINSFTIPAYIIIGMKLFK